MSTNQRRGAFLATAEGVRRLKEAKRIQQYTYQQIAEAARETEDKVKRLFNPQWGNGQYKVGEEAVQAICGVLDLKPEEIVSDWYPYNPYDEALEKIQQAARNGEENLNLSNMKLTKLPPEIEILKNIKSLNLNRNKLSSLPVQVENLLKLEELFLSNNNFNKIPSEIIELDNLCRLEIRNNKITEINFQSGYFINLRELYLDFNEIELLPKNINNLKKISQLSLRFNRIKKIPPEIGQLLNLKGLYLGGNELKRLPSEIGNLSNLVALQLEENQLKELTPAIGNLLNLRTIRIRNNNLRYIPVEFGKLSHLSFPRDEFYSTFDNIRHIKINKNIVSFPLETLRGTNDFLEYCRSLLNLQRPLHEAKMLLVGQGNVGKTCLRERLIRDKYDPTRNKTDGIDIENWTIQIEDKELQINIWDFGGQEIMHSTHQFFLTKRSLYLLVLDTTIGEEENRIEYWLKIIQSFGKDSPVVIVGNKADQHPLDIDKTGLKQKYPQIRGFWEVSCEIGTGIPELAQFVKSEINQLEHIDDVLPLPWFNIKEKLEELDQDYIPYEQYESLCETEGVEEEDKQRILIRLLNDLGIVLNFQDDPRLEDTHVLNPEWVTNGVYKILNDRQLIVEDRGILTIPTIKRILDKKRYPVRKHLFIIGMMRKFELCFDIETDKQFLIPDILPKEEPYTGEWENTLAFEYHYPVLPGSIISRFIVRMNHYIHQTTYWRSGVVLANEGNLALVKADREDKIIKIRVKGKANTRRNLLTAIRSQFDYIHKTIPGIVPVAKVPLIEHPEILLDYQDLLALESMGETTIIIPKLQKRLPLSQLLAGIKEPKNHTDKHSRNKGDP